MKIIISLALAAIARIRPGSPVRRPYTVATLGTPATNTERLITNGASATFNGMESAQSNTTGAAVTPFAPSGLSITVK